MERAHFRPRGGKILCSISQPPILRGRHFKAKDYHAAIDCFEEAIARVPAYDQYHCNLVRTLFMQ